MASELHNREGDATRLFEDLVRCETRLYNAVNDRLRAEHGIVTSQFEFLRYLRDHTEARVADIAASFAIGVGATSKGIDRLEARGWVQRMRNPADRRSSLLALTPLGTGLVDAADQTFTQCVWQLIDTALTDTQLSAAVGAVGVLRDTLERDRIGAPIG